MSQEPKLSYPRARQLYLDVSSYPITIAKFQEFGLSEEEAKALATVISADVDKYEQAVATHRRDLRYGLLACLGGLALFFLTDGSFFLYGLIIAGGRWLSLWFRKRKIIKNYEAIDAQLTGINV